MRSRRRGWRSWHASKPARCPAPLPRPTGRAGFGLPELDGLLGGGLTRGSTTVLAGAPGVGKTLLGLAWALAEDAAARRTVVLSFGEHAVELEAKARAFGLDLAGPLASGALTLLRLAPSELQVDGAAARLLEALTPTTERLVVDDLVALLAALGARAPDYLAALAEQLYARGVTSLLLYEIEAFSGFGVDLARTPLSVLADTVLILQQVASAGQLHRVLAVLKMRYSAHDRTLRELVLEAGAIRVRTRAETAPGVRAAGAAQSRGLVAEEPPGGEEPDGSP